MSDPAPKPAKDAVQSGAEQPAALPRGHILSYVAVADSPTRVRQVAGRAVWIIGLIYVLIAAGALTMILWALSEAFGHGSPMMMMPGLRHPWLEELFFVAEEQAGWIVLFGYAATCGTTLCACAGPVGRGRKLACYLASIALVPSMIFLLLAGVAFAGDGLFFGVGIGETRGEPVFLLLVLPGLLMAVLVGLVGDLVGFLLWVARNPITEKPAVPFLPRR